GERPLYERLMALPGQAILTAVALPVLAPILVAKGVKRVATAAKARRRMRAHGAVARAPAADTPTPAGHVHEGFVHAYDMPTPSPDHGEVVRGGTRRPRGRRRGRKGDPPPPGAGASGKMRA